MCIYFNPRSPWGERRCYFNSELNLFDISIHALREESDLNELFDGDTTYVISIHALREESDGCYFNSELNLFDISIHALREESDDSWCSFRFSHYISIHALREESD